jgi:LCP family protein required for cell wall assembly
MPWKNFCTVPFTKTSLASRRRKKRLFGLGKTIGTTLSVGTIGTVLFLPKIVKKIRQRRKQKRSWVRFRIFFGIIFSVSALTAAVVWTDIGRNTGKNIVVKTLMSFGSELPKDNNGFTNILLLGSGGGEAHAAKGHKLTDSMMIASVDISGRNVVILSIPRDFFVETPHTKGKINEILRDESRYFLKEIKKRPENLEELSILKGDDRKKFLWKLEAEADESAKEEVRKKLEEIFDIDIHRTVHIDFRGFEKFVDAIDGIDLVVEKTINDPTYPDFEWGYDPFYLEAGQQHIDGSTALKYARSRHGTSDFDRARRQQKILSAIKEKMMSLEILTSPEYLKKIFDVVQENYVSDISWSEIITLAEFASKFPRKNISSYVLNDDPKKPGGFLVTPNRELYGGAFVLVPFLNLEKEKYTQLKIFAKMIFQYRNLSGSDAMPITILNGTNKKGLAGRAQNHLERFGWHIKDVQNAEEKIEKTIIEYSDIPWEKEMATLLTLFFPAELHMRPSQVSGDINNFPYIQKGVTIVLGLDYEGTYRIPKFSSYKK